MRISDLSSDVCSSDLEALPWAASHRAKHPPPETLPPRHYPMQKLDGNFLTGPTRLNLPLASSLSAYSRVSKIFARHSVMQSAGRSEERRVGKECVSTCRSRGSP